LVGELGLENTGENDKGLELKPKLVAKSSIRKAVFFYFKCFYF